LVDLGVDGRLILEWMLIEHCVGRCGLNLFGSGQEFPDHVSDCQLLNKDTAP